MTFDDRLDELRQRRAHALEMGGAEKVARQKSRGKLTARERISALVDDGSFREIGAIAGAGEYDDDGNLNKLRPSNFIFGRANIERRAVVATADDFTVRGGASDAAIHRKFVAAEQMAGDLRLPIVRMIDGTGGGGSVKSLEAVGRTYVPFVPGWEQIVANLDTVPVVSLALGPTAGLGAARLVASHYSVMVRGLSQVFTAGPKVAAAIGSDGNAELNNEDLGGADIHATNGVVDDEAATEHEAFDRVRRFLSYLPSAVGKNPPSEGKSSPADPVDRREPYLLDIIPERPDAAYNMRRVLEAIVDRNSLFEMGARWGRGVITAFARLDNKPVAVLASDPTFLGGSWTADGSEKAQRFVELADKFRLPVVHFVDNPGFMIGLDAEKAATIRRGVDAMNAIYKASVPWASVIVRKAYGVAGAAMSNHSRFQYRFAWPSADWGSLPMAGGVEVAYKKELSEAPDPAAALVEIKQRLQALTSPFRTAEAFLIEDIIDPRETRPLLCEFASLAYAALDF